MFEKIEDNIKEINKNVAEAVHRFSRNSDNIKIMAVTKTVSADAINFAISKGIKLIGENRVPELLKKFDVLNKANLEIHFIGHLQTNKVKNVIDKVSMIESVDSLRLAEEINLQAEKIDMVMDILVEINIGSEQSKFGIAPADTERFMRAVSSFNHIKVKGLMAIPPNSSKSAEKCKYFCEMRQIFVDIKTKKIDNIYMEILSMGMSGDYIEAIEYQSNIIRLGRAVFGERI